MLRYLPSQAREDVYRREGTGPGTASKSQIGPKLGRPKWLAGILEAVESGGFLHWTNDEGNRDGREGGKNDNFLAKCDLGKAGWSIMAACAAEKKPEKASYIGKSLAREWEKQCPKKPLMKLRQY